MSPALPGYLSPWLSSSTFLPYVEKSVVLGPYSLTRESMRTFLGQPLRSTSSDRCSFGLNHSTSSEKDSKTMTM